MSVFFPLLVFYRKEKKREMAEAEEEPLEQLFSGLMRTCATPLPPPSHRRRRHQQHPSAPAEPKVESQRDSATARSTALPTATPTVADLGGAGILVDMKCPRGRTTVHDIYETIQRCRHRNKADVPWKITEVKMHRHWRIHFPIQAMALVKRVFLGLTRTYANVDLIVET